jgi:hypothetical protein
MNQESRLISLVITSAVLIMAIVVALNPHGHAPSQYPTKIPGIYWKAP